MTDPEWFSELVLRVAGALLHFVWQGAALAFLAAVGLALVERRAARPATFCVAARKTAS